MRRARERVALVRGVVSVAQDRVWYDAHVPGPEQEHPAARRAPRLRAVLLVRLLAGQPHGVDGHAAWLPLQGQANFPSRGARARGGLRAQERARDSGARARAARRARAAAARGRRGGARAGRAGRPPGRGAAAAATAQRGDAAGACGARGAHAGQEGAHRGGSAPGSATPRPLTAER